MHKCYLVSWTLDEGTKPFPLQITIWMTNPSVPWPAGSRLRLLGVVICDCEQEGIMLVGKLRPIAFQNRAEFSRVYGPRRPYLQSPSSRSLAVSRRIVARAQDASASDPQLIRSEGAYMQLEKPMLHSNVFVILYV